MTCKEFSDAFDTLIAAYNHKSEFGDLTSLADVTLDEYEKSVFLTLALDLIVKSYFSNRTNSVGEGFDDSIRRQADFSSLITKYICEPYNEGDTVTWSKGSVGFLGGTVTLTGLNEKYSNITVELVVDDTAGTNGTTTVTVTKGHPTATIKVKSTTALSTLVTTGISNIQSAIAAEFPGFTVSVSNTDANLYVNALNVNKTPLELGYEDGDSILKVNSILESLDAYDERGRIFSLPAGKEPDNSDPLVLLMLNERVVAHQATGDSHNQYLVVVPISYTEYDRLMSRAYAQPLKKQAWRLFLGDPNADATTRAEIITNEKLVADKYIIRYVRRPRPIILTDLDLVDSQVPLEIDGKNKISECELNPILHMDILLEAVRLALGSKGIETRDMKQAREAQRRSNQS